MINKCPKCNTDNPDTKQFCGDCGTQLPSLENIDVTATIETPKEELTTGSTFAGRYQIIEELGKGGMGRVYKVLDKEVNAKVALKLIKPEIASDKKTIERFRNELKVARDIAHKNVCQMYHLGKEEGAYYITMEYVSGEDLKSFIRRAGFLSPGKAISIANQVCEGLLEAHRLGVIHRDLKPQNIMIDKEGNARIMDFGIARSLRAKGITGSGVMIGTPEYMSPEQVDGKEADQRADIYSLGVILYEMVTGQVPFEGDTPFSIGVKQKSEIPRPPKEINEQIPEDLNRVILKCMEKDKEMRYQSVGELHSELMSLEKGIPTKERVIPERKPLTSREITVTLGLKKLLVPALVFIAIVIVGVIIWQFLPKKEVIPPPSEPVKPSIAVLPFEDLSSGKDQEALADGIPETLINALSSLEGVYVSARTSSFSFKGKQQDIREIGQKLGVETLLEGSVQVAGNKLRIMVRLVNIEDGFPIWSENYNKAVDDVFVIQDDIARSVVKALKIKLLGEEEQIVKSYTSNREAYDLYLRGRFFWEKRGKENLEKAIEYFERAIEKDPDYALAYAGLADSYVILGNNLLIPAKEAYPKAKTVVMKALEIDESLAEAHVSLAAILEEWEHNFREAEREYKIALELKPGYATAHHWYAFSLSYFGRHDEAIEEIWKARELDPLSPRINANVGNILYWARQYDRALEELKRSIELFPEHSVNYSYLSEVYAQLGQYEDAINVVLHIYSMTGGNPGLSQSLAYFYALSGNRAEAQKRLRGIIEYSKKEFVQSINIARVYVGLGDKEQAFIWLEKAFSGNESTLVQLKKDPTFDPLHSDPRFSALLKKIGLED